MTSSLLHLVGLRPRVYYTLTNLWGGGGGKAPLPPPPNMPMLYEYRLYDVNKFDTYNNLQNCLKWNNRYDMITLPNK